MDELFFSLIQISLGNREMLSRVPTEEEWGQLFELSFKQSIAGVCFAGVLKLHPSYDQLYYDWGATALRIQTRNEELEKQNHELQNLLSAMNLKFAIFKGQPVSHLYTKDIRAYRQYGDIDIWIDEKKEEFRSIASSLGKVRVQNDHHITLKMFGGTLVELHFLPTYLRCPWHDKTLKEWLKSFDFSTFPTDSEGLVTVPGHFNLVFIPLHIFRHLMGEGIGMKQLLDWYFVYKDAVDNGRYEEIEEAQSFLKKLGVGEFVPALMYLMKKVFGMDDRYMIYEPDPKLGEKILDDIMSAGAFGKYHENRIKGESRLKRFIRVNTSNLRYISNFPAEVLCTPLYRIARSLAR